MARAGHNVVAADQLRSFVERIERLEEEKAALATDIREVFAEAKSVGYDIKALRKVIKLRAMDTSDRINEQHLVETYARALGLDLV